MTNLKLPVMTLDALKTLTNGKDARIAYKTCATWYAYKGVATVSIKHHGNVIATISPNILVVTSAGWNSVTTANRLRKILRDNNVNAHVFVKDGLMRIKSDDGERYLSNNYAHFARCENGKWVQMYIVENVR